jgi:rhodanese-related sulfurtransferase
MMMLNKIFRNILLVMTLGVCLWLGVGQQPIWAAPPLASALIGDTQVLSDPNGFPKLETAVDRYLMSIPQGYYTIGNVAELKSLMATHQPLLIDVRSPSEYRAGHIAGATNIPLQQLARNVSKVPTDRPVVLYCSTGYRSAMGVMTLHLLNYDNVRGFPPSLAGWQAAGEAIVK